MRLPCYNLFMSDPITHPHDHYFKEIFTHKENAVDFVQHYLPPEVVKLLDVTTLEISKDSFVDSTLQELFSDLLYQVSLRNGQSAYIYLLFDHKSYVDNLVSLQLLGYMVRIWELWLKQQESERKELRKKLRQQGESPRLEKLFLPPIMPLVLYHGVDKWNVSTDFTGLFELPEELRCYTPQYQYWLCDLSSYSDSEIKGVVMLQVGLLALKYIHRQELKERLPEILKLVKEIGNKQTGLACFETLLRYLLSGAGHLNETELAQVVKESLEKGEVIMGTIAEKLILRGRQEGRQKGRQEGRQKELKNVIQQALAIRFGIKQKIYEPKLKGLSLLKLRQLHKSALIVSNLAEFEAKLQQLLITKAAIAGSPPLTPQVVATQTV